MHAYCSRKFLIIVTTLLVTVAPLIREAQAALVTAPTGAGETTIFANSTPSCGPMAAPDDPTDIPVHNGDTVRVPMNVGWHDYRSSSSAKRTHTYEINATYQSTEYKNQYSHDSYGQDEGQDSFYKDVPNVEETYTIHVWYSAMIFDDKGLQLCITGIGTRFILT